MFEDTFSIIEVSRKVYSRERGKITEEIETYRLYENRYGICLNEGPWIQVINNLYHLAVIYGTEEDFYNRINSFKGKIAFDAGKAEIAMREIDDKGFFYNEEVADIINAAMEDREDFLAQDFPVIGPNLVYMEPRKLSYR